MVLFELEPHADERGSVTEVFRRSWLPMDREILQANLSLSRPGVLRGLHFHREQSDYWCLLRGAAFVGLYDLRTRSPSEGVKAGVRLSSETASRGVYIPPGVAHGFYAETDLELVYFVDAYYSGSDEFGVAWDDPRIGIDWPTQEPILSERDRSNPRLDELTSIPAFAS
ncbi:MAG TPA: dTDP-4-dehydrorhamnose 3,5-epimerase family protein [Actinomycetota bacterium]